MIAELLFVVASATVPPPAPCDTSSVCVDIGTPAVFDIGTPQVLGDDRVLPKTGTGAVLAQIGIGIGLIVAGGFLVRACARDMDRDPR
jgi:hypothetical protein